MKTTTHRRAFSLVELLVVIALIVMLVTMMGAAMSAARTSGKRQKSKSAIAALDPILQRHFSSCESTPLDAATATTDLGVSIRQKITADMPDSWAEVRHMRDNPSIYRSARHRGYVATLNAINPSDENDNAECLFMIVMQGGLADCLTCSSLDTITKGDKDGDGALEFWDAWGTPIRYVLWPGGFQLPPGSPGDSTYFDKSVAPFSGVPTTTGAGTLRPLIFSGGPSKLSSTEVNAGSYLAMGTACGDPTHPTIVTLGGFDNGPDGDNRSDNITNYDDKVKK